MVKKTYGDDAMHKSQTYKRFSGFKEGRTSVEDDETFRTAILRKTISDLYEALGLLFGTCQRILTKELGMH